ncbi:MAG: hypothetical protein GY926_10765 [bacterium]|nr:hypothetical protein [bacterium]MCP4965706.1 hypothetical protein [bacterium]
MGRIGQADAQLVDELYPELRRFAGVVAPWDMDPDDVLHAALVNILRKGRLHTLANPGAYFRRAIVNHVKSEIGRTQARRTTLRRLRGSAVGSVDPTYPSDVADLMRLRPVERAVVYLHDIEGLSFDVVAEMVGVNPGSARVAASRARRRLREELVEEGRL